MAYVYRVVPIQGASSASRRELVSTIRNRDVAQGVVDDLNRARGDAERRAGIFYHLANVAMDEAPRRRKDDL